MKSSGINVVSKSGESYRFHHNVRVSHTILSKHGKGLDDGP